jgi:molecular chaperone GrpE
MEENKTAAEEAVKDTAEKQCEGGKCSDKKKDKKCEKSALEEKIAELEAKLREQDDKYLRMAAEYDNFRRRSREEREGTYEAALCDTVSELLPIIDNLERAANYDDGEKVKEGLLMTAKSTIAVFEKLGVEEFGKVGETFDPNLHNAVLHVDDEALGEGEIVEVFQKGYKKGKHIIRFAMVKSAN